MIKKTAQISVISLWILLIISILAVTIGQRVSMALRLSSYRKNRVKSLYLAKAGIKMAILELEKDKISNAYDSLNETWYTGRDSQTNKVIFADVELEEGTKETFTVKYLYDESKDTYICMIDEEAKININEASRELLLSMLEKSKIADASKIADNIRAWRGSQDGDITEEAKDYQALGYDLKASNLTNIEELTLVKDVTSEIYESIKELITVYGYAKANINTVSETVLDILIDSCVKELEKEGNSERDPQDLLIRIISLLQDIGPVASLLDLRIKLENQGFLTSAQVNILNKLEAKVDTKSSCFYIVSSGKINNKLFSTIRCIFDRDKQKIVYWHEN